MTSTSYRVGSEPVKPVSLPKLDTKPKDATGKKQK